MTEPLRLLFVEDSDDDAELVLRFVKKYNSNLYYERVQTEHDMQNALQTSEWNLVISDFNMPQFSGMKAIKTLRDSGKDIPFILVSGTVGEEVAVEALKSGASDYVLKSNLGRLPTSIGHVLREKSTQEENRGLLKQLELAQKMEAIGRLAGGIAHDINNVLAAITLYAELAAEQIQSGDTTGAHENIQGILKAQKSAVGIIRQLLVFSRQKRGPTQVINIGSVVKNLEPLIKRLLRENIELTIASPGDPITVSADPVQIEQIVMNLEVNARDAMADRGNLKFSLETAQFDEAPSQARIPIAPGKYAVLSVQDTGSGMSPEILQKIFEPFFTTKEVGKGTGLGLSVIYGILQQAKGSLIVESVVGRGTTFKILWPLSEQPEVKATEEIQLKTATLQPASETTILLVEDEDSLRRPLVATLKKQGYQVLEATNGEEGYAIMSEKKEKINLLVTDVVMPKMSGPEFVTKARELAPNLRVLFLSGYIDDTRKEFQVEPASTWFLEKPFTSRVLGEKVAEILKNKLSELKP